MCLLLTGVVPDEQIRARGRQYAERSRCGLQILALHEKRLLDYSAWATPARQVLAHAPPGLLGNDSAYRTRQRLECDDRGDYRVAAQTNWREYRAAPPV